MIKQIDFDPAAREELRKARVWHEQQQAGLGLEFAADFDRSIAEVLQSPERFPRYLSGTQRCLLHRFKYLIVFLFENDCLAIVAVSHGSRRPGYWRKRLNKFDLNINPPAVPGITNGVLR
jgi:hypothetical protein